MFSEPQGPYEQPGPLKLRITRLLARAWPKDEADQQLAAIKPEAVAKGNGHLFEQALYALDKESAKAVLDRAFLLGNLLVGSTPTITALGDGALHGYFAIESFAITLVQVPGALLATLKNKWAREIGRGALLIRTGIGIGLL